MLDDTLVTAFVYPTGHMQPQTVLWFVKHGVPAEPRNWRFINKAPHGAACNAAMREALASGCPRLVFVEYDMLLQERLAGPWWEVEADVVCMRYGCGHWWEKPDEFHLGCWRTRREVLNAICPVDFTGYGPGDCHCAPVAKAITERGFSIRHGGYARHLDRPLKSSI